MMVGLLYASSAPDCTTEATQAADAAVAGLVRDAAAALQEHGAQLDAATVADLPQALARALGGPDRGAAPHALRGPPAPLVIEDHISDHVPRRQPAKPPAAQPATDLWGSDGDGSGSGSGSATDDADSFLHPGHAPHLRGQATAPSPQPVVPAGADEGGATGAARGAGVAPADPAHARALLVICYNRPEYLTRTLQAVQEHLPGQDRPHIYVSQDGHHGGVTQAIQQFQRSLAAAHPDIPFSHLTHEQDRRPRDDRFGYQALARHFGWALDTVFKRGHPHVIILEDDLEIAPDFFEYFSAMARVMATDPTILAASAYNDLGQEHLVESPRRVYRSDFFPGLGWMLSKEVWAELQPKWPDGYWDDWLREPEQRKGRAILHPEVSRTRTFGRVGVSQSQFFDKYLASIRLNTAAVNWADEDVSYLAKNAYDPQFRRALASARRGTAADVARLDCKGDAAAREAVPWAAARTRLAVQYDGFGNGKGFVGVARQLDIFGDVKANVPRTAYQGVVSLHMHGCEVFLVPGSAV